MSKRANCYFDIYSGVLDVFLLQFEVNEDP